MFAATNNCRDVDCVTRKNKFVATNGLSQQAEFCRDKRHFFLGGGGGQNFVVTKDILWQLPPMIGRLL